MRSENGFTLLELLIVMALIAIIAAVAAPSFNDTAGRNQARAIANDYFTLMRFARAEAFRAGKPVNVGTIVNGGQITGARAWQELSSPVDTVFNGSDVELRRVEFKREPTVSTAVTAFNSDGTAAASTTKLCINGSSYDGHTISVLSSGLVAMSESTCP